MEDSTPEMASQEVAYYSASPRAAWKGPLYPSLFRFPLCGATQQRSEFASRNPKSFGSLEREDIQMASSVSECASRVDEKPRKSRNKKKSK
ncbi:hypothetical protein CEXT_286991 [Caerostris extrusa]|uniref:Uncharacterized protein n=1 Tax=Caerostris extrusa TaxID=172846 RepID=A0AAV4VEW0_CAEEX|nr:hypothetical protein CEXT_286991 [Caerostris extrusa]